MPRPVSIVLVAEVITIPNQMQLANKVDLRLTTQLHNAILKGRPVVLLVAPISTLRDIPVPSGGPGAMATSVHTSEETNVIVQKHVFSLTGV